MPSDLPQNHRPGSIRERMTDPEFIKGLASAPIILAMDMLYGHLTPVYGATAYFAAGGTDQLPDKPGRIDEGVSEDNPFPAGTFVMGVHPEYDDIDVLLTLVAALRGRCEVLPGDPSDN